MAAIPLRCKSTLPTAASKPVSVSARIQSNLSQFCMRRSTKIMSAPFLTRRCKSREKKTANETIYRSKILVKFCFAWENRIAETHVMNGECIACARAAARKSHTKSLWTAHVMQIVSTAVHLHFTTVPIKMPNKRYLIGTAEPIIRVQFVQIALF